MKAASSAMQTHLAQGQTTLAVIWKVKRVDGTILGFTNHDLNIAYDDGSGDGVVTYLADSGFAGSAIAGHDDLTVDNLEATGFLKSDSITEADLRAGLYDDAFIQVRIVNWNDLTMGDVILRTGTLGVVKMKNGAFIAELRGLAYKLTTILGVLHGPVCRAAFGSGLNGINVDDTYLCMVDVTLYRQNGSVSSAPNALTIIPNTGLLQVGSATPTAPAPTAWFNDGWIKFTSGVLNGFQFEIKVWDGTNIGLYLPMPYAPAASDTFQIEPGCNHTTDDCQNKFANIVNFRGENLIPGMDQILLTPSDQ